MRRAAGVVALVAGLAPAPALAGQAPAPMDVGDLLRAAFKRPPVSANQTPGHVERAVLPSISYNPAIGLAVGGVLSIAARRGSDEAPLSSLQATAAFTTQKQIITALRTDLYTPSAAWSLVGDARFYKGLQETYGLGSETDPELSLLLQYYWTRLHQTAYRRVKGPLSLGAGYHLDSYADIKPREGGQPEVVESTVASGVSANLRFDSRDNSFNARRGVLARASYYYHPTWLGSDGVWGSAQFEGRAFVPLPSSRRQVLAFWSQVWLTTSGDPPYFNLPSVGWDTYGRTARGYTAGRYRGRDWVYGEAEYRVDLVRSGLAGAVAFVNTSTLSDEAGVFGQWAPAGGFGFRLKLDKRHGTNIAMDFAWGRGGSSGIWFGLNEAF